MLTKLSDLTDTKWIRDSKVMPVKVDRTMIERQSLAANAVVHTRRRVRDADTPFQISLLDDSR
jgi:hypothetical protein